MQLTCAIDGWAVFVPMKTNTGVGGISLNNRKAIVGVCTVSYHNLLK
jgi:hypothetical protein